MAPARKKCKAKAVTKEASNAPTPDIRAFGKISKSQVEPRPHEKSKLDQGNHSDLNPGIHALNENPKKRKLDLVQEPVLAETSNKIRILSAEAPCHRDSDGSITSTAVPAALLPSNATKPIVRRKKAVLPLTTNNTPTNGARTRLESFILRSPLSPTLCSSPFSKSADTKPSSPVPECSSFPSSRDPRELPDELQDLINLHSSFLTALSLHYVHHGLLTPADLRIVKPSIERSWRKRRVSLEDVRRLLAIQEGLATDNPLWIPGVLSLSDYGMGKICIEIADNRKHQGFQRRLLNEEYLNAQFSKNLSQQWSFFTSTQLPDSDPSIFVAALPLAPITRCSSLTKTGPLLAKGQLRLTDLKAGAIKAQQRSNTRNNNPPHEASTCAAKVLTASRSSNLLSRIVAKQLHQSTLPVPQSPEALARKSALQRLQEVIPVLDLLTVSTVRSLPNSQTSDSDSNTETPPEPKTLQIHSFTMPTLVQHLQMSLRNPISKEEAVRCVRVLAEVAPEWVGVREVGKLVGMTMREGERCGREEMGRRIARALGEL